MARIRIVRGFHGTVLEHAEDMARGNFKDSGKNVSRWLGRGIYFFEENFEFAQQWAAYRAHQLSKIPAVVSADIDLSNCLDLTRAPYQAIVRLAHRDKENEWTANPASRPTQKEMELHEGIVRTGYGGDWENYGRNELDFEVIEHAVKLASETQKLSIDTVRGAFIELGPLYKSSWLYEGAHVSIAVREPFARISNVQSHRTG